MSRTAITLKFKMSLFLNEKKTTTTTTTKAKVICNIASVSQYNDCLGTLGQSLR